MKISNVKNTFPNPKLINYKEIAILESPAKFPDTNMPRLNKMLSDRAEDVFKELAFVLNHLPSSYRYKICNGPNFKEFIETLFDFDTNLQRLDDRTRDLVISFASQALINSFAVLKTVMPQEFKKPLIDSIKPFASWMVAISDYAHRNSLKDIPPVRIPNAFFSYTGYPRP